MDGTDGVDGGLSSSLITASLPTGSALAITNSAAPATPAPVPNDAAFFGSGIPESTTAIAAALTGTQSATGSDPGMISAGVYGRNLDKSAAGGFHYGVYGYSTAQRGAGVLGVTDATSTSAAGVAAVSWQANTPALTAVNASNVNAVAISASVGTGDAIVAGVTSSNSNAIRATAAGGFTAVALRASANGGARAIVADGDIDLNGEESGNARVKLPVYVVTADATGTSAIASCTNGSDIVMGGGCAAGAIGLSISQPNGINWQCGTVSSAIITASVICLRSY